MRYPLRQEHPCGNREVWLHLWLHQLIAFHVIGSDPAAAKVAMGRPRGQVVSPYMTRLLATIVTKSQWLTAVHPRGFEPLTFGSVDWRRENVTSLRDNDLQQCPNCGYSHGYRSDCHGLSLVDIECHGQLLEIIAAWLYLPAEIKNDLAQMARDWGSRDGTKLNGTHDS